VDYGSRRRFEFLLRERAGVRARCRGRRRDTQGSCVDQDLGPTDAIIYEPKNHLVYVAHDDGAEVWVIDPANPKIVDTVTVPGAPEFMIYDESTDRIYLEHQG